LVNIKVLFVCTANVNRSPMGAGLLAEHLGAQATDVQIRSAGFTSEDEAAAEHAIATLSRRGIDISSHRSRLVTPPLLEAQDLILVMAREHLQATAVTAPHVFRRTFTIKEFIRRGLKLGPRRTEESVDAWFARIEAARDSSDLLGKPEFDDVEDPVGEGLERFERTAQELDLLTRGVAYLLFQSA